MKVGDKLWYRDGTKSAWLPGGSAKRPERDYWVEREIVGETRVSWLIGRPGEKDGWDVVKIKKTEFADGRRPSFYAVSEEEIAQRVYVADHGGYKLGERVQRCYDYATVCKIVAALDSWEKS